MSRASRLEWCEDDPEIDQIHLRELRERVERKVALRNGDDYGELHHETCMCVWCLGHHSESQVKDTEGDGE